MMIHRGFLALALLACFGLGGCGWSTPSVLESDGIQGRITDAETNVPVADAIVLIRWEGISIPTGLFAHSSNEVCFFAAVAVSDANGHYQTAPWTQPNLYNVDKSYARVFVYKKDYWLPEKYITNNPTWRKEKQNADFPNIKLKRFKGTVEERIAQFRGPQNHCEHAPSQDELVPLTHASYEEARAIAGENEATVVNLRELSKSRNKPQ